MNQYKDKDKLIDIIKSNEEDPTRNNRNTREIVLELMQRIRNKNETKYNILYPHRIIDIIE